MSLILICHSSTWVHTTLIGLLCLLIVQCQASENGAWLRDDDCEITEMNAEFLSNLLDESDERFIGFHSSSDW